ncbi:MAG: indole-3-glycerol phosphate synthase TrpC [Alphaproteobacteria bacterium]|nr:MAG: indole-3-glycerol phosphate synthase TrpC [Alphaproteobacteria bacterium]
MSAPAAAGRPDVLERIRRYKLDEIAARKAARPQDAIERAAAAAPPVRPFRARLAEAARTGYGLIAEIKRASPSRGLIRPDFDPPALARAYEAGGATCLSVLTDAPSFQGHEDYLVAARAATALPVLRKDFLFDPWQVAESRAIGADCILIIMAAVEDALAAELAAEARRFGMDALFEVHDEAELERALALGPDLLGINNRDLRSFEVSLETTRRLAPRVPEGVLLVAESGLFTPADLAAMAEVGARAFLIGESLMRAEDVAAATRALLADPLPPQAAGAAGAAGAA